jgi:hypothetical protein
MSLQSMLYIFTPQYSFCLILLAVTAELGCTYWISLLCYLPINTITSICLLRSSCLKPCSKSKITRSFGGIYCLQFHGWISPENGGDIFFRKVGWFSTYYTELNLHNHRYENLKSYMSVIYFFAENKGLYFRIVVCKTQNKIIATVFWKVDWPGAEQ